MEPWEYAQNAWDAYCAGREVKQRNDDVAEMLRRRINDSFQPEWDASPFYQM